MIWSALVVCLSTPGNDFSTSTNKGYFVMDDKREEPGRETPYLSTAEPLTLLYLLIPHPFQFPLFPLSFSGRFFQGSLGVGGFGLAR